MPPDGVDGVSTQSTVPLDILAQHLGDINSESAALRMVRAAPAGLMTSLGAALFCKAIKWMTHATVEQGGLQLLAALASHRSDGEYLSHLWVFTLTGR